MTRSRASSRWRAANVRGESGSGGRVGSVTVPSGLEGCWAWGGGEPCDVAFAVTAAAGAEAGAGGAVELRGILARRGAEVGSLAGGVAGVLSW